MGTTRVSGRIAFNDGTPALNHTVKAYDWDAGYDDFLGEATVDQDGNYSISFDSKQDPGRRRHGRFADVYIKVYPEGSDSRIYQSDVHWNVSSADLIINANIDAYQTTTKGRILFDDGTPAIGFKVQAWDSDIGYDDFLGDCITDANGEYAILHRSKQDFGNRWRRRFADIYIKIIEKNGTGSIYQSETYEDYANPFLVINAVIDKVLGEYGRNCIYGQLFFERHDGSLLAADGLKVKAYDRDIGYDDLLGETHTDSLGKFVIHGFNKDTYDNAFEGDPDVYLYIYKNDEMIWRTGTDWSADLPLKLIKKIPEIIIAGSVKEYKYNGTARSPSKLRAYALDFDTLQVGPIPASNDMIGSCNLKYNEKQDKYEFTMHLYGSKDEYTGSDIFVILKDTEYDRQVWSSDTYYGTDQARVIWLGPLFIDYTESGSAADTETGTEAPSAENPFMGAGTQVTLINKTNEIRAIFKKTDFSDVVLVDFLFPGEEYIDFVGCGIYACYYAKEKISDTYNSVTFILELVGACNEQIFQLLGEIWY